MGQVRRLQKAILLCIAVLFLFAIPVAGAETSTQKTPKVLSSFADGLFGEKDYYRAITEYKRLIFHFPNSPLSKEAALKIPIAYLEGKQYETARRGFEKFREAHPKDPLAWEALYLMGEADYRARDYQSALTLFSKAEEEATLPDLKRRAASRRGSTFLKMGRWQDSAGTFRPIEGEDTTLQGISGMIEKGKDLPRKSPKVAGTLSAILPGSGQLYIGRKRDAVVSFLLNGAFIVAAHEAFKKDEHAVGGILLFFEAGWYAGNIYSAASGAHKYNRAEKEKFIRRVEGTFSVGINDEGGPLALFNLRY